MVDPASRDGEARRVEVIGRETRTIPAFALERFTRDQQKWEPKSRWPVLAKSGDWRVVIYGSIATLEVTRYRYIQPPAAATQLQSPPTKNADADLPSREKREATERLFARWGGQGEM